MKKSLMLVCSAITLLSGCHSISSVQRSGEYELCRLSILQPLMQEQAIINEANRQISAQGIDCSRYAGLILGRQQQGLQQLQQGLDQLSNPRGYSGGLRTPQNTSITCFKTNEWISGSLKNCSYNCMGSQAVQTISSAQVCPLSITR